MPAEYIRVKGVVQGVGFRPTVWRLAQHWQLTGFVRNDGAGVLIGVDGANIDAFVSDLLKQLPPLARVDAIERTPLTSDWCASDGFIIEDSQSAPVSTDISVDAATCEACRQEISDPSNRRYAYPFTNCTHCGPRLSIIAALPYDRANTSMAEFVMCVACEAEYGDPASRRFHAQPNACNNCGPQLQFWDQGQRTDGRAALDATLHALRAGKIVAVKGVGGFHLMCDASRDDVVGRLRARKRRPAKPLAVLARDVAQIRAYLSVSETEAELLQSAAGPIVLLSTSGRVEGLSCELAPGLSTLGCMLPSNPLHHLMMADYEGLLVATSGNASGLPPCIDNDGALEQLAGIADVFLLHNRRIVNRLDDSVMRVVDGQVEVLRLARGLAPLSLPLSVCRSAQKDPTGAAVLALGGELKSSFALARQGRVVLSQYWGDLTCLEVFDEYCQALRLYRDVYQFEPDIVAVDKHPHYASHREGAALSCQQGLSLATIQHHHAHIASCLAENGWSDSTQPVIGIALDGSGYGDDGGVWGGEIVLASYTSSHRLARLQPTPLPGGDRAVLEPWRSLVAQWVTQLGVEAAQEALLQLPGLRDLPVDSVLQMLAKRVNCPATSSTGRLFDAVAALLGCCTSGITYEGQAAIELEACTDRAEVQAQREHWYAFDFSDEQGLVNIGSRRMWLALLADWQAQLPRSLISARFHGGLAQVLAQLAGVFAERHRVAVVALSGGCMQNVILRSTLEGLLRAESLQVLQHRRVPANDAGLALGQAAITLARQIEGMS